MLLGGDVGLVDAEEPSYFTEERATWLNKKPGEVI
jgi:hypothetical protein